jgi:hypothetical protein
MNAATAAFWKGMPGFLGNCEWSFVPSTSTNFPVIKGNSLVTNYYIYCTKRHATWAMKTISKTRNTRNKPPYRSYCVRLRPVTTLSSSIDDETEQVWCVLFQFVERCFEHTTGRGGGQLKLLLGVCIFVYVCVCVCMCVRVRLCVCSIRFITRHFQHNTGRGGGQLKLLLGVVCCVCVSVCVFRVYVLF